MRLRIAFIFLLLIGIVFPLDSVVAQISESGAEKKDGREIREWIDPGGGVVSSLPSPLPAAPPIRLERISQDVVVLVDAVTGRTVLTLPNNWTPELIDVIGKSLLNDREDIEPAYTIHEIDASGTVQGNKVKIDFRFLITTKDHASVRVPLGLKEGVLLFPDASENKLLPDYAGNGNIELVVDPASDEYVALIRPGGPAPREKDDEESAGTDARKQGLEDASRDRQYDFKLTLWFPVTKIGEEESKLAISFPVSVRSQFSLIVPVAEAVAVVSPGTMLYTTVPLENDRTEFSLRGLKSNFDISWRKKKTLPANDRLVLSVEGGSIVARLGEDRIDYEVMLPIRCRNGTLDRFRMKLPAGVSLLQEDTFDAAPLYTISRADHSPEDRNKPVEIEVKPLENTAETFNFSFRAVQPVLPDAREIIHEEINGFEVIGADKQFGMLLVEIPPDRQLFAQTVRGIKRNEAPDRLAQKPGEVRFEFFAQPFVLRLQAKKPQTRINVRPEYIVRIDKDRMRLTARLLYTIHGSKVDTLSLRLPGWELPEVGPLHQVDVSKVRMEDDLLSIPLQDAIEGTMEIELETFMPMPALSDVRKTPIRIPLPILPVDSSSSASVAVVPADCIQLFPRDSAEPPSGLPDTATLPESPEGTDTIGLTKTMRRFRSELPQRQQAPLIYQSNTADVEAVFAADVLYHPRQVSVNSLSEVRLLEANDQVVQTLTYTILHERLEDLYLLVPKTLDEQNRWKAYLDRKFDRPLETMTVPMAPEERHGAHYVKKRIPLDRIGTCTLTLVYSIDRVQLGRDFSVQVAIPFILPGGQAFDHIGDQRIDITVQKGIEVLLHEKASSSWGLDMPQSRMPGNRQVYRYRAARREESVTLLVSQEGVDSLGTTVVDKAWVQSWLGEATRTDHLTFQFTSDRDSLVIHIPGGVPKGLVGVRIDGKPVEAALPKSDEVLVPLTEKQRGLPHILEVWYRLPFVRSGSGTAIELPRFGQGVMVRCMYWQIILPKNEHLLGAPEGWTSEYTWGWNSLFFGRYPALTQEEIGLRVGDAEMDPVSEESNRYLFSTLEQREGTTLFVFSRGTIVLFSSGLALAVGLILIYVPQSRHAGSLFGLGVVFLATFLYQPAPVLLLLQASILGILLSLLACYLHRLIRRPDRWSPIAPARSSSDSLSVDESSPPVVETYSVIVDETNTKGNAAKP